MGKTIAAVVVGFVVWSVLWVGGTAFASSMLPEAMAAGERVDDTMVLAGLIIFSVLVSLVSGYAAAMTAGAEHAGRAAQILAVVLLAVGIAVETSAWDSTPAWYHIVFLVLLVPATILGARMRST